MKHRTPQDETARYYSRLGSRLGYLFVMKRSQHFGYYDKNHTTEQSAQYNYHENFSKLLSLEPGMKILDAGSGQGVVACYLAQKHRVGVTGITITPHEVTVAKKRARKLGVSSQTHFVLADYANPPFADGVFDRIYTTETLSHAVDVAQVLETFMRLLKPGGVLVCAEYEIDHENLDTDARKLADFVKDHAAIHAMYQFAPGQFVSSLKSAGFKNIKETDWTTHVKPSFDRLRKLASPVAKIVENTRLKSRFVNTLAARLYADGVERGIFAYKVYIAKKHS